MDRNFDIKRSRLITLLLLNRIQFLSPIEKYTLAISYLEDIVGASARIISMTVDGWRTLLGRNIKDTSWSDHSRQVLKNGIHIDLQWIKVKKGVICTIDSPKYPYLLRCIADPPIVLFILGNNLECLQQKNISIVGTRLPNKEGIHYSYAMGNYLAKQGINIVSGFAFGIDIAAHRGVMDIIPLEGEDVINKSQMLENFSSSICYSPYKKCINNRLGKPIVVLGTSVDNIYPKAHIDLARKVLSKGGLIISEFSPSLQTRKYNFIGRNRIISGLSMDSIIVQAPKKSGSLATADFALEQGRNLWVHNAGISEEFEGTLALWGDGASKIIDLGSELLEEMPTIER